MCLHCLVAYLCVQMVSKDSNVVVVAECINVFGLLAKGLRKEFASYARNIAGQLLEKYKVGCGPGQGQGLGSGEGSELGCPGWVYAMVGDVRGPVGGRSVVVGTGTGVETRNRVRRPRVPNK